MATMKFKSRADLLTFAAEHRGSLAAQFLVAVHNALSRGDPRDTRELKTTDVVRWASELTTLKDIRDQREVQTLALVMSKLNAGKLDEAADTLSQRIKAIMSAKAAKGTWEKSQLIELLPVSGGSLISAGELSLTGLGV